LLKLTHTSLNFIATKTSSSEFSSFWTAAGLRPTKWVVGWVWVGSVRAGAGKISQIPAGAGWV